VKLSHFFIDRPIFATVLSILITLLGALSYFNLPVEQYPEITPPTIQVTAGYAGANAETVAKTVATPLEQAINGVENMLYMTSQATNDGQLSINITFELGTNLDMAQVLVQNRVATALPRLPEEVRQVGVVTKKRSPDLMLVINLSSPDKTYDQLYLANYATLQIKDVLSRIEGVGDVWVFGGSEYAMRIWVNPDQMSHLGITPSDVLRALRAQNIQVASGTLNKMPMSSEQGAFEISVQTQGRLVSTEQFEHIIVKTGENGHIVRISDIARVELGAQSYSTKGYLDSREAVALPLFQRPGSNALEATDNVIAAMETLKEKFPAGMQYDIVYNPTEFVKSSMDKVILTLLEAVLLVTVVMIVFLQSWRAAIIPILAIPVSLIGTFAFMQAIGYSLNTLSLFGLVLAIGIVVDDAIVVVENMERLLRQGLSPREAGKKTMDEVGGALIAMGLVLVAAFLPTTFLEGMSGQFYKQFGATIAVATVLSVVVSLTLSPAMAVLLLRHTAKDDIPPRFFPNPFAWLLYQFNHLIESLAGIYAGFTKRFVRLVGLALILYVGLMAGTQYQFKNIATGFIPEQDQGYLITIVQLPAGASFSRTEEIVKQVIERAGKIDGIAHTVSFTGLSGATFTNASNAATIFSTLDPFDERAKKGITAQGVLQQTYGAYADIQDAMIFTIAPPPVRGMGNAGGFKMMVQDKGGVGSKALEGATWQLAMAANQDPIIAQAFTIFETGTPQLYLDIDREKAERLGVPVSEIFDALGLFIGSAYVNDFNYLGRTYRVMAQGDAQYRLQKEDLLRIHVRNKSGDMLPLSAVATARDIAASSRIPRYNLYPAAELMGATTPGYSTGDALQRMEELAAQILPVGVSYEWTEIAYQQRQTGNTAVTAFVLAVLFIFLLLAAQYESWTLPLAVILIVPMCLLSAITGLIIAGMDNNILTQIGFVVLVGLAAKNAILIVEFAKQEEDAGMSRWDAATAAAKLRLRPILMTSIAFILGVVPLVFTSGAGAEMRQALGTTVFSGMIGVTFFGLIFTPLFYVVCRRLAFKK